MSFMMLSEQIFRDYLDFLKLVILPPINKIHKLKLREIRVLMCMGHSQAEVSATDLAEMLRQDPSTITRSVVELVRGDFVETRENIQDGRSKIIVLKDKGRSVVDLANNSLQEAINKIDDSGPSEESTRSDSVYLERLLEVRNRAAFVLNETKRKG